MRPLNLLLITLLCISLCTCSKLSNTAPQTTPTPQGSQGRIADLPEPLLTLSRNLTIAKKTGRLPNSCKAAFAALTKETRFEMADPGEEFLAGDVISGNLPRRRLVFGGVSHDRCFIHYEKGGYAHTYKLVLFALSRDGRTVFIGGMGGDLYPSLERLRTEITRENIALDKTERGW